MSDKKHLEKAHEDVKGAINLIKEIKTHPNLFATNNERKTYIIVLKKKLVRAANNLHKIKDIQPELSKEIARFIAQRIDVFMMTPGSNNDFENTIGSFSEELKKPLRSITIHKGAIEK